MPHNVAEFERLEALRAKLRNEPNSRPPAPIPPPAPSRPKNEHLACASPRFFNHFRMGPLVHTSP
jgi:hypothetical protein